MESIFQIKDLTVDNSRKVKSRMDKKLPFHILTFASPDEEVIDVWIEDANRKNDCTIMIELSKDEAYLLGKTLVALSKTVKP